MAATKQRGGRGRSNVKGDRKLIEQYYLQALLDVREVAAQLGISFHAAALQAFGAWMRKHDKAGAGPRGDEG